jgi:hypothetical protein
MAAAAISDSETGDALLPRKADGTITARTGGNTDLRVTIIWITPAAAFKETMSSRDLTQGYATRQLAAWINYAASKLTHIQGFSAWMFARRRTLAAPNTAHKQHTRPVVIF